MPEFLTSDGRIFQKHALKTVSRIFQNGNLAHAWLLAGQEGTGREQLARIMAALLLCEAPRLETDHAAPCGRCAHCGKLSRGTHPDLNVTEPDGAFIKLAQVHELQKNISYPPLEARNRAVLILNAHRMNREAANALLKTLEEPPENTYIILTSKGTSSLLPTIISRCQLISCAGIGFEDIAHILKTRHEISEETAHTCARLSDGSLVRASEMAESGLSFRKLFVEFLALPLKERFSLFFDVSENISKDNETFLTALTIIRSIVRDLLLVQSSEVQDATLLINGDMLSWLEEASLHYNRERLSEYATRLEEMERLSNRNIKRDMLANAMLAFWVRK